VHPGRRSHLPPFQDFSPTSDTVAFPVPLVIRSAFWDFFFSPRPNLVSYWFLLFRPASETRLVHPLFLWELLHFSPYFPPPPPPFKRRQNLTQGSLPRKGLIIRFPRPHFSMPGPRGTIELFFFETRFFTSFFPLLIFLLRRLGFFRSQSLLTFRGFSLCSSPPPCHCSP